MRNSLGTLLWVGILLLLTALLIVPTTRELFNATTAAHPYLMGFIKFAILSTMGEFLALRLVKGRWSALPGMWWKAMVWGFVGVLIVLMFGIYGAGIDGAAAAGLLWLPASGTWGATLLRALLISSTMNLTFGVFFMGLHRITDTLIDARANKTRLSFSAAIDVIDWKGFIHFVVGRTIPLFWIPAHTITFLLPESYRVLFAASLSIFLGLILSYAKLRKSKP